MTMNDEPDGPQADPPIPALRDELLELIRDQLMSTDEPVSDWEKGVADAIMAKLNERGHYLPGAPCAQIILNDAKSFAERLTITTLALRLLNMLAWANVETPESKPARQWLDDYLEGKNHGPAGKPMLWPVRLPGICALMREWGFEPTPTMPPWVARSLPNPTMQ